MRYALTAAVTLVTVGLLALAFPYTGLYNVSATAGDSALERWYLSTMSERSIRARAAGIETPPALGDSAAVRRGAVAFAQMCQGCHGAPGHERNVAGQGLTPTPPRLSRAVEEWSPAELFWILDNGIKMAGMPAYGPTHTAEELWELVAFVRRLPGMTPERYATLTAPVVARTPAAVDSAARPLADDGHDHVH